MDKRKISLLANISMIIGTLFLIIGVLYFINNTVKNDDNSLGAAQINNFWDGSVSATTTTLTAGKASVVLTQNSARNYAVLTNVSDTIAYLAFNSTTTPNAVPLLEEENYVIPLAASGGTYTINLDNLYLGQVIATSSAAVEIRALETR